MAFRFKAFGVHLLASVVMLTVLLGALYLGWYRWPGWYLTDVSRVVLVMAGVDLVIGPLLTLVIANPTKIRRMLIRDVGVIVVVQLCALLYGTASLWNGRPLYYAFSETVLQVIQAYDIDSNELALARQQNVPLIPHWYSLPRWIWAPLPEDPQQQQKIVASAVSGGDDVISMPRYYRPWEAGLPVLQKQLKKVDEVGYFSAKDKAAVKARMSAAGYSADQANAIPLTGRGQPLCAIIDPASGKLLTIIKVR